MGNLAVYRYVLQSVNNFTFSWWIISLTPTGLFNSLDVETEYGDFIVT